MSVSHWLSILGIGEDGVEGLAPAARAHLRAASVVYGGARHLALAAPLLCGEARRWPHPLIDAVPAILAARGRPVAVLASGDPFCYGIGSVLVPHLAAGEWLCLPAPSAFSLAAARLGWAAQETELVSLCGRSPQTLIRHLHPGTRILALSADAATPACVAALLCAHGFGATAMTVLEALGGPRERVRHATADCFAWPDIDALNVVALHVAADPQARVAPLGGGLAEVLFEHDGQITKREVRAATLAALAPLRGGLLWDVGCGSGSVGIEWLRLHPANRAIAIEARPDRAARARRNAASLGVPALDVRVGAAPAALAGLPAPDAVFVGGGGGDAAVLEAAWQALRAGGRMVVNAVSLRTEAALVRAWERWGGSLTRTGIERLEPLGGQHGFRPAMTVTQWAATRP